MEDQLMTQAGLKQELTHVPKLPARDSGRYSIDPRSSQPAARPQRDDLPPNIARLLELNTLSDEELTWIEARNSQRAPNSAAHSAPPAVFAKADEEPRLSALQPFYREPTLERVQLQFEDLSLDPSHNPLAHSSLLPPPRRALPLTQALAVAVGALAVLSVGYLTAVASSGGPGHAATVFLPARKARAPHVLQLVPPSAARAKAAPRAALADDALDAPAREDIPWSVAPAASQAAASARAATAPAIAASATDPTLVLRRREAWRARMLAARNAVEAQATPALLEQPTREQIKAGIDGVRPAMLTCAAGTHGMSTARVTVAGSGRVAYASIEGAFAGTPQGSCMALALRNAVFPRFSAPNLQVTYPFRF
jgi:hypothetical protein